MTDSVPRFSLVIGGPVHGLLERFGLLGPDQLPTWRTALAFATVAWLPPALLAGASHFYLSDAAALSYFIDYPTHIRSIFAIGVMVMTERMAHFRLMPIIYHFREAKLVADEALEEFWEAVAKADRWTGSVLAECLMLTIVIAAAAVGGTFDIVLGVFDWDGRVVDGRVIYSWAGWWSHWVSKPIFLFLLLRWVWRFLVWGLLLLEISMMRLRLIAFHPDRSGGLAFLSVYPTVFSGIIFAMSSVLATQLASEATHTDITFEQLRLIIVFWTAFMFLGFTAPLAIFARPLYKLREESIFRLGKLASEHQRAFEQKWLDSNTSGGELLGSDISSAADLAVIAESPYTLRLIPLTLAVSVQLFLSIWIPMIAVILTQMPLSAFFGHVLSLVK